MEVVEVLAMDQQVQHIVTLTTHLKPRLYPVQFCGLEELGSLEGPEQVSDRERGREGGREGGRREREFNNKFYRYRKLT